MHQKQVEALLALMSGIRSTEVEKVIQICAAACAIHAEDREIVLKIVQGLADDHTAKRHNLQLVVSNSAPAKAVMLR